VRLWHCEFSDDEGTEMESTRLRRTAPPTVAFWLVALALSVAMLGTTLPTPLYVIYQQQLGFSTTVITLLFATYAAGVLLTLVVVGHASDDLGRRRVLLAGLACAALSTVVFLLADDLPMLFVGRVLSGFSAGIFTGTATATLVDLSPRRGSRATLVATAFNMGGLAIGPLLAGLLAQLAPLPLRLPFWVVLGLIGVAAAAVWAIPETVPANERTGFRFRLPEVPPQVRPAFVPAATAGFAGFAVLGIFAAVAPSFLGQLLHEPSHALSGAIVFAVFGASALGQVALSGRIGARALHVGLGLLIAGMGLLAASLAAGSLALLVAAAIVAGLGQGLSFHAGLDAVSAKAPADLRGTVASSFFIVMYLGISVPVIGEGIAETGLGLRTAGIAFSVVVAAIAAVALATLVPSRKGSTQVAPALSHSTP
jgi:MFS family permease